MFHPLCRHAKVVVVVARVISSAACRLVQHSTVITNKNSVKVEVKVRGRVMAYIKIFTCVFHGVDFSCR